MWEPIPAVHTHHGPERLLVSEKDEGTFIGPLLRNVLRCGEEVCVAQRWAIARVYLVCSRLVVGDHRREAPALAFIGCESDYGIIAARSDFGVIVRQPRRPEAHGDDEDVATVRELGSLAAVHAELRGGGREP